MLFSCPTQHLLNLHAYHTLLHFTLDHTYFIQHFNTDNCWFSFICTNVLLIPYTTFIVPPCIPYHYYTSLSIVLTLLNTFKLCVGSFSWNLDTCVYTSYSEPIHVYTLTHPHYFFLNQISQFIENNSFILNLVRWALLTNKSKFMKSLLSSL